MSKGPFRLMALLISVGLLVTACSTGSSASAAKASPAPATSAPASQTIRVGYMNVMDDAPAMLAQDAGFYAKHGLNANLQMFNSGTDLIKAIVGGQLDAGILGFTNAVTWAAKGADLKVVGGAQMGYHSLLVKSDSTIKTVADLKGHSLATQDKGTTADIVLNGVVLPEAKLSRTDINMVYVSPTVAIQSLQAGKVDAAFVFEPYASMAKAGGNIREVYEIGKVWPFPCMVVITSGKDLAQKRAAINALLDAQKDAINMMTAQPADAAKLLTKRFIQTDSMDTPSGKVPSVDVVQKAIEDQKFNWQITPDQVSRMQEIVGIMVNQGVLTESVDVKKVLDLSWQESQTK